LQGANHAAEKLKYIDAHTVRGGIYLQNDRSTSLTTSPAEVDLARRICA
jgi:hypothetical protein